MLPTSDVPTHPGEILLEEFLRPMEMSAASFARHVELPINRVRGLIHGRNAVDADMAWRFSQAFGTTPEFWLNLQRNHDLGKARPGTTIKRLTAVT